MLRFPIYSLKTSVLFYLVFLIIAAMLLINVVMMKFTERDLIQAKINTGRLLIQALGHWDLTKIGSDPRLKHRVTQLLAGGGFYQAIIADHKGIPVFSTHSQMGKTDNDLRSARETLETGLCSIKFSGKTWGVIWLNNRELKISAPLISENRTLGAITISASLLPIYQSLRKSEKVILLYTFLDTIILAMVGVYLLSRTLVKPIKKLLQMTEEYKEGDLFPPLGNASRNEIGQLSRSLNIMLRRLEENKKELKAHISSLEKANMELKQAQDEIIRTEKLASVGRLAAGVAHEIGNPLGIILGYLELIRKGDIDEKEGVDFLNRIESEITKINQIIRDLLDFSRPSSGKKEKNNLHDLINNTVKMLKPQSIMADILINIELEASNDVIFADPNQLQQVFLNILMNAADAFTHKDKSGEKALIKEITIKSKNVGNAIELRFTDNGLGISEEGMPHIFDPFYTTKEPGKGTGLGLSVCYKIIEGLGGTIRAKSTLGKGTTIIIELPLYGRNESGE